MSARRAVLVFKPPSTSFHLLHPFPLYIDSDFSIPLLSSPHLSIALLRYSSDMLADVVGHGSPRRKARMIVSDLGNDRYIEVVYDSLIKECRLSHSPVAFFRFIA